MSFIKATWDSLFKLLMLKASDEQRIRYLRKQGVKIGERCRIRTMSFSTEPYLIQIGNHVAVAANTQFITHDGATWGFEEIDGGVFGKIAIGNNVFIGINCIILSNTTIGDNCIVGAGSVLRGNFPENSIIAGNPAQIVSKTGVQRMLFRQSPGLVKTNNLPKSECTELIKKHFGID
jgi:acetyltransferase-like isoleucine patch superfamily enzyme